MSTLTNNSINNSVSVGRKVVPKNVNSRRGRSSNIHGLPFQRRCGNAR